MAKKLMKGCEAIGEAAIHAGCRLFFGYPITPQNEIPEYMSGRLPQVGGVFVQAESEVAASNMLYGAAGAGCRCITSSSSPGISLMQEGISYLAGAELPCVIVTVMRGGPGLGNIGPEQSDYHQVVWGGGHGNYRNIVLAPASVQEMCDLTMLAFELADRYRNPVIVATDGYTGQMVEPLEPREPVTELPPRPWAVRGDAETRKNLLTSIWLDPEVLEQHNQKLEAKYQVASKTEQRFETYRLEDAEEILIGYGIVARVLRSTVDQARERGVRAGLLRPITLWPFPVKAFEDLGPQARAAHVFELSNGQMLRDVQLTVQGRLPVTFYGRTGGVVPSAEELLDVLVRRLEVIEHA